MRRTTLIAAAIVSVPLLLAAQQPRPDNQPGRLWTESQLREASSHVRAGRSLNPKTWPNGARVAVALTFNVNNSANQIARGDTAVVAMTGGEFGAVQGLARVHEVLDAHDVPATFFVSGVADLVDPQLVPEIVKRRRHEIGVLGWSDENVVAINDAAEEARLLTRAVDRLSASAGRKPAGARGPSGAIGLHTMTLLRNAGILYDSTLQAMDRPYEVMLKGQPSGIVELPVNAYINDFRFLTSGRTGPGLLPSPELIFETFRDAESYYATLAHETTHWTAHESRLARDFGTKRFGSEGYAIEELVAELGAAFLCADLDLTLEPREDHAAYIPNWLDVLKADNRAIFTAASHAQRAADFINGPQPASAG